MNQTTLQDAAQAAQHLTFQLAGDMFAVGILAVKEIIEFRSLTEVPMMPAHVRGVINLRGAVVPVMDPLARLGRPSSPVTRRTCVVIVEVADADGQRQSVGMLVDAVSEVIDIPPGDVEPPPPFGARIRTDFVAGIAKVRGRFVILLATDATLALDSAHAAVPDEAQAELT